MKNTIKGGKADKMSVEDIAKKFNVSVDKIKAQIKKGIEIEKEHTNDKEKATEIAMDHVTEFPDYYDRIEKMEKSAKKKWDISESKTLIKKLLRERVKQKEHPMNSYDKAIKTTNEDLKKSIATAALGLSLLGSQIGRAHV